MILEIYNKVEIFIYFVIFCDMIRIDKKKKRCVNLYVIFWVKGIEVMF